LTEWTLRRYVSFDSSSRSQHHNFCNHHCVCRYLPKVRSPTPPRGNLGMKKTRLLIPSSSLSDRSTTQQRQPRTFNTRSEMEQDTSMSAYGSIQQMTKLVKRVVSSESWSGVYRAITLLIPQARQVYFSHGITEDVQQ
jgi:hypothetical protein